MRPNSLKRRRRSFSIMSVIPIDIFASEILPRLPTTTLLRFKCLNKFFYHYISSQLFSDLQLRHSAVSHTHSPLIVFLAFKGCRRYLYFLDVDSPVSPARYLSLPPPFRDDHRSLKVVGCCNGLLCLNSYCSARNDTMHYYAIIVNPSTGRILSNISLSTKIKNVTCSGLGYDNLSKDYKLVVVEYQYHREQHYFITIYRKVSVFSLKSNSWSCIETTCLGGLSMAADSKICVPTPRTTCALIDNCLMHWLLKSPAGSRNLVCFNLEKERWVADIPLPDFHDYDRGIGVVDVGVLNGCLCFSVHNYDNKFHVWIMKEYEVHGSWTKFFIDIPGPYNYYPIFACQHAPIKEILLAKRWHDKPGIRTYVWYNIRDKTAKELLFSGAPENLHAHSLCLGSLANCFRDCLTQECKGTQERMRTQDGMKIDDQVKILQANMSNNVIRA